MNDTDNKPTLITLDDDELLWCKTHATDIVDYYGGEGTQGSGTYNHNKISSNLVGVKSEVAMTKWLKNATEKEGLFIGVVKENYRRFKERGLKGDIQCNETIIEVKGLRPHQWNKFKRMIPPYQLKQCVRNNALVVWALATGDSTNGEVKLMGWNYALDIQSQGVEVRTICDNIWLESDSLMRPMNTISELISSPL